jgi:hypothetical protein
VITPARCALPAASGARPWATDSSCSRCVAATATRRWPPRTRPGWPGHWWT